MTDIPQYLSIASALTGAARGYQYSGLYRFGRGSTASQAASGIVPQVVAWPHSTDLNGDSYPSGIVGVRLRYRHERLAPTTDADAELIAVPAVLPAGYTPRWLRDHNQGSRGLSVAGSFSTNYAMSSAPSLPGALASPAQYLVRADDGMYDVPRFNVGGVVNAWLPENQGTLARTCLNPSGISDLTWPGTTGETLITGSVAGGGGHWFTAASAGVRYMRFAVHFNSVGWMRIQFGYNASGAITTPMGTVLETWAFAVGGAAGGSGVYYSPTVGPIESTLGSPRRYGFEVSFSPGSGSISGPWTFGAGGGFRLQMGPRLDIPFPFLTTGEGSLIAPGGIVPGTVPGY